MKTFLLLEVFVILSPSIGHSQNIINEKSTVTLSPADEAWISNLKLPSSQATYLANMIMERHQYSNENKALANENKALAKDNKVLQKKYYNAQCLLPHADFRCAMLQMKLAPATFYKEHVSDIVLNKTYSYTVDPYVQRIIKYNDNCPNTVDCRNWRENTRQDLKSANQWYEYARQKSNESEYKITFSVQSSFVNNLTVYFDQLRPEQKEKREYTDLNAFFLRFGFIITRCHRLSTHYHHSFEEKIMKEVRKRDANGVSPTLSEAIIAVAPSWYLDEEHIELLNILQTVMEIRDKFYSNQYLKEVLIPGLPNCGIEKVSPGLYEKLYSLAPTEVMETVASDQTNSYTSPLI